MGAEKMSHGLDHNRPMQLKPYSVWWPRVASFLLWIAASTSIVFWGLKWSVVDSAPVGVPSAGALGPAPVDQQAMARLLGAGSLPGQVSAAPSVASRYTLLGVVAGSQGAGVALISVDGKAARPVEVGARVDDQLTLVSVSARRAALSSRADAPPSVTLELPPLKAGTSPNATQPIPASQGQTPKPNPFQAFLQKSSPI